MILRCTSKTRVTFREVLPYVKVFGGKKYRKFCKEMKEEV
jgi:hypothetical protein